MSNTLHGFEREGLRVTAEGLLAPTPHPTGLGDSLTHPYITTDFAEAQLEFITAPEPNLPRALDRLTQIHYYAGKVLKDERLWPFSMPPRLPEKDDQIPLAHYGSSKLATEKTTYRRGLGYRYGRRKQTLSGVHYNFSLDPEQLKSRLPASARKNASTSDAYFHIIRNLYRHLPFLTYLFGASPAIDKSYNVPRTPKLKPHKSHTLYAEFATSLRLSNLGYTSEVQDQIQMRYDSLSAFIKDFAWALNTINPDYEAFSNDDSKQLNANYLQNEQELYALFRPKQQLAPGEKLLQALQQKGTSHIEARLLDIDPSHPEGVDPATIAFLHIAILHCLQQPSPPLSKKETKELHENHQEVIWQGRKKDLQLSIQGAPSPFHDLGKQFCERLHPLAEELDQAEGTNFYQESLTHQIEKWNAPELTPSGKLLANLLDNGIEFLDLGLNIAEQNAKRLAASAPDPSFQQEIERQTKKSRKPS